MYGVMKRKTRRISIGVKIVAPVGLLIILVCLVIGLNSYLRMKDGFVEQGIESADVAAGIALDSIDADKITELNEKGQSSVYYNELMTSLRSVKERCGIAFLYVLRTDKSKVYYSLDTDDSANQLKPGAAMLSVSWGVIMMPAVCRQDWRLPVTGYSSSVRFVL